MALAEDGICARFGHCSPSASFDVGFIEQSGLAGYNRETEKQPVAGVQCVLRLLRRDHAFCAIRFPRADA